MVIYQLHYPALGVIQHKTLITHDSFLNVYRPNKALVELHTLENRLPKNKRSVSDEQCDISKKILKEFPDLFFTDKSPLYEALVTGVLNCNGKSTPVTFGIVNLIS
jgi:hypothetical protein